MTSYGSRTISCDHQGRRHATFVERATSTSDPAIGGHWNAGAQGCLADADARVHARDSERQRGASGQLLKIVEENGRCQKSALQSGQIASRSDRARCQRTTPRTTAFRHGSTGLRLMRHNQRPKVDPPHNAPPGLATGRRYLASAPLDALLRTMRHELAVLVRLAPDSSARTTLAHHCSELARALDEAARTNEWLSVADVAVLAGRPESTVKHRLARKKKKGKLARSSKCGRVWEIHRDDLEELWAAA